MGGLAIHSAGQVDMSVCVAPKPGGSLATLPNEVLVRIFLYLDPSSLLSLRNSCHRFRLITSDPICWPRAIVWEGRNCARDICKLNFVLHVTKGALKEISVSFLYPFSNYVSSILTCRSLEKVSVHNIACTRAQIQKLLSLPLLSYLHVDQLDNQQPHQPDLLSERLLGRDPHSIGVQLLEIVEASGCKLKTLSFKIYSFELSTVEKWIALKCTPPDLRIALVRSPNNRILFSFLHLQPAIKHEAYLSVYDFAFGSFAPTHPFLQFRFTPNPSLALVHYPNLSHALKHRQQPLVLTASNPSSKKFSCASFYTEFNSLMETSFEFLDISNDLTALHLSDLKIVPSTLTAIAQMCPNLQHLDLSACYHALSNPEGVSAVAAHCLRLRVLNLSKQKRCWSWESDKLWTILQSMSSLRALFVPSFFIDMLCSKPVSMPQLTDLHILGDSSPYEENFLLLMPSLKVLECKCSELMEHSGISKCLHAPLKLTHLYLETYPAEELSLPKNPCCYLHLQKFFLECRNFVVNNALMDAMSQSKELRVLAFRVKSVSAKGVKKLIASLPSLSIFHIQTACFESGGKSSNDATGFVKSMRGIIKRKRKFIDLNIDVVDFSIGTIKALCPEHFKWFPS